MPHAARIELIEVKPEPRSSGKTPMQLMQAEAQRIRAVLPQGAQLVTLDGKGKEFDSSYKRGEPIAFPLSRVVPCWTQGMQKIKVGGKAKLTCPAATAYGERGVPGVIPPGATLNFEVELVSIKK